MSESLLALVISIVLIVVLEVTTGFTKMVYQVNPGLSVLTGLGIYTIVLILVSR